jgi:enamine deaminase RidA (YjgF/YER057c/UK114 family)
MSRTFPRIEGRAEALRRTLRGRGGGRCSGSRANVREALAAGGAGPEHIIKRNIYVVEGQPLQAGFAAFQNAWPEVPNPPAITGVFVSGLAHPDFLVEMDAVAVVPQ